MLDLTLARLLQQEREQEIADRHRLRAIREARSACPREDFIPPARGQSSARRTGPASIVRGST